MQINLDFLCMLAECQQNFHLPEHMKEGSPTYTYFYILWQFWTPFFTFSRTPFHILLCSLQHTYQICISILCKDENNTQLW